MRTNTRKVGLCFIGEGIYREGSLTTGWNRRAVEAGPPRGTGSWWDVKMLTIKIKCSGNPKDRKIKLNLLEILTPADV